MKRLCWKTAQKRVIGRSSSILEKKNCEGEPPSLPPLRLEFAKKGKKYRIHYIIKTTRHRETFFNILEISKDRLHIFIL